jgi:hypothetical protein
MDWWIRGSNTRISFNSESIFFLITQFWGFANIEGILTKLNYFENFLINLRKLKILTKLRRLNCKIRYDFEQKPATKMFPNYFLRVFLVNCEDKYWNSANNSISHNHLLFEKSILSFFPERLRANLVKNTNINSWTILSEFYTSRSNIKFKE